MSCVNFFYSFSQAKTSWLLERLSPWRNEVLSDEDVASLMEQLRTTLLKVANLDYIVRCCITAALPKLGHIRELLLLDAGDGVTGRAEAELGFQED